MASNHSHRLLLVASALAIVGGCGQILGISDYQVDPSLDSSAGAANPNNGGDGGKHTTGGSSAGGSNTPAAGEGGRGGEPPLPQGGQAQGGQAQGGQPPTEGGQAPGGSAGEGGGAPLGQLVPCDSAECCTGKGGKAVGVELLKDGGFETGTPADGSPWGEVSTTSSNEVITNDLSFGFTPKAGDYFTYLSGIASEESTIYQDVVVPKDAGWLVVSGYRLFQVDSQDNVNLDFCGIGFYTYPAGDLVELPFYWGRPSDSTDGWGDTPTWKFFQASWDATPHQGLKREIDFRGSSDAYSTDPDLTSSSYLFDELSLKVYRCYK